MLKWFAVGLALLAAAPAFAQTPSPIPRTADGHPDLQGVWDGTWAMTIEAMPGADKLELSDAEAAAVTEARRARLKTINIPIDPLSENFAEWPVAKLNGRYRSRAVVSPPSGRIPYTAAAAEVIRVWSASGWALGRGPMDGPEARTLADRCIVMNGHAPFVFSHEPGGTRLFVQTPSHVMIHSETGGEARVVRMNGSPLPDAVRSRLGDSIGRWEGDVLVVETRGFPSGGTQIEMANQPPIQVGRDSRVIERFQLLSPDEMLYQFTIEDPALYAGPWLAEYPMRRSKVTLREFACHEGNYGLANILQGAREAERKANRK